MRIAAARTLCLVLFVFCASTTGWAAPYAAMVIDARNGNIVHSRNADTRLHPASLTKMMTLYIAFQAVQRGEISLNTRVKISRNAAAEPPSKLGLRSGQRIELKYLIRAAAVRSANDAATAIAEAISGSEAAFARRMTQTARQMGMSRTTFKNAHGLTQAGHLSTARDMTTLGRRIFYDFPQYYNLFARPTTYAGIATVTNTNRRLLANYRGADGIKTGYTSAAGYNLVSSARRGNKRVIATVFGGKSTASRNAKIAELLDLGFRKTKTHVAVRKPAPLGAIPTEPAAGVIRLAGNGLVRKSPRPRARPVPRQEVPAVDHDAINDALLLAQSEEPATQNTEDPIVASMNATQPGETQPLRVVTRAQEAGGRTWAVQIGSYHSRADAERALLKTALRDLSSLQPATRRVDRAVVNGSAAYRARFVGLSQAEANMTCARLRARNSECMPFRSGA